MTWLTSLPAVVLVAAGLVLALLATLGGRLAVRALVPAAEREAAYTIAAPLMAALGALFALFVGLTLASEASFLASAQGIRSYEWSGVAAASGEDPATVHALANLANTVRAQAARTVIGTPASTELLASLDALTSDRRDRLAAASHQLPVFYVVVLVLAGVALIVNASALTLRSGRRSALLTGSLASVIGLSLALLFALGTPWRGAITVSGQPIDAVTQGLNTGYFTP